MSRRLLRENVRIRTSPRAVPLRSERLPRHGERRNTRAGSFLLQRRDLVGAVGDAAAAPLDLVSPLRLARDQDLVHALRGVSMRWRSSTSGTNRSGRIARKKW